MKGDSDKLFDDLLRKSVGNYQVKPSPAIWKGILQKVPARRIGRIPFSGGNSGLISFISGGILVSSVAVYNHNSNKHHKSSNPELNGTLVAQTITQQPQSDTIDSKTYVYNSNQNIQPIENNTPVASDQKNSKPENIIQKNNVVAVAQSLAKKSKPATTSFVPIKEKVEDVSTPQQNAKEELTTTATAATNNTSTPETEIAEHTVPIAMATEKTSVLADLVTVNSNKSYYYNMAGKLNKNMELQSDPMRQNPRTMKISKWQGDYAPSDMDMAVSLFYQPEWLSNSKDSRYATSRQTAGAGLSWKKRPFTIETGVNIMQEKAWQDYDVTFQQLLGTYNNLQSVTFENVGGVIVPHYHYSIDSVFDPNHQTQKQSKLATYTYLQIPLSLGLEKSYGRSSFSFKTGPVLSFLIDNTEEKLIVDADKHVITIAGDHPNRLKTSWQWYLGLGYSYAITDRFTFFFEPSVRGYLDTPYERKRIKNASPVYMGIKTGVSFQFKNPLSK